MKYIVYILAATVLLSVAFFLFAPESRVEAVKTEWRRWNSDPSQVCFDQWSDRLKSPDSASIVDSRIKNERVYVTYRAKNSFGTYLRGEFECPIEDGEVDLTQTLTEKVDSLLDDRN